MDLYNEIFENNKRWVEEHSATDAQFFRHLAEGQSPEFLYIGCSDSRVTAEEMTGIKPGQMFVHRNIANLVPNNDMSSATVIEYAVNHLDVSHIIVCGHYFCGGVKAAMESRYLGILNPWLREIRDVYRIHAEELNQLEGDERYKRLVELNVQEQCINVIKVASVQKHYLNDRKPRVHGWVFDVQTGRLIDLKIDFDSILHDIQKIYDLGTAK